MILQGTVNGSQKEMRSMALERDAVNENVGFIIMKNGKSSMFPHYCVLLIGMNSKGPCVIISST
jgi:hypothetical protein